MSKPNVLFESLGRRPLPTILVSGTLVVAALWGVLPSSAEEVGEDQMMRQVVQYLIQVGTDQSQRGYYIQAEKTLLMAQGYHEYLTVEERTQLNAFLEKIHTAALERKRALEHRQTATALIEQGDLTKAKPHLESVKDSRFLTETERGEVADLLRSIERRISGVPPLIKGREDTEPARPPAPGELGQEPGRTGELLKQRTQAVADLYYRSMDYYRAGQLEKAREGFLQVIESGLIPTPMARTLQSHLARIEGVLGPREVEPAPAPLKLEVQKPQPKPPETTIAPEMELAANQVPAPERVEKPEIPVTEIVSPPAVSRLATEQPSYIEAINRRRNIIRSHTKAVVNDAVEKAQSYMSQGQSARAKEIVQRARSEIDGNRLLLGDELFKEYSGQLGQLDERITQATLEQTQQLEEQKRREAVEARQRLREQMEAEKQTRIKTLMESAKAYQKQQRYEAALGQLETLLVLDPQHEDALVLKDTLEDTVYFRKQLQLQKEASKQWADTLLKTEEASIPYAEELTYPKNWREIVEKRQPDKPIGLDPADVAVYEQLDQIVDLSQLSPTMPLSEAIDILRNSVEPPLKIVVLWRDLLDNAEIEPTTAINMDGIPAVRLGTALENLLQAVAGGFADLGYVVENGVITIATLDSLPSKMETRVYDITDLVAEPANFRMPPMMGMMGMGGMGMMGMGMGGYGMGGMGGYGMGGYGMGGMGMGGYGMGGMGMQDTSMYRAEDLMYLIQDTIEPDSWYDYGGEAMITLYPRGQRPKKMAVLQTREVHNEIEKLLEELRRELGYQVSIEARFLMVSENFLEDIGLDVDFTYNLGGKWGQITVEQGSAISSRADAATKVPGSLGGMEAAATVTGGYGSILDDLQVSFLLRMTQGRTDAETLTAPKATVLSGESATFSVQDVVSYALPPDQYRSIWTGAYPGGGTQVGGIQQPYVGMTQTGTYLTISPTISRDKKNVLLNIMTQLQDLLRMRTHMIATPVQTDDTVQVVEYPLTVPETETSQVMTRVSVPDGGTLLLGGQKITAEIDKEVGVPILSKIPIIGVAFGNRSKIRDQKILLILVKPTIILQEEREKEAIAAMESGF